ncbi:response regulator [Microcoleus sp. T2B6]|uniref:response regulator n=1 Tax=Microcoleus sp. T2B6 TaxID=3055424 RepID=UPI002FD7499D
MNIQVLANNLLLEKYALAHASSGREALAILDRGYKPALILLYLMRPRMTGYEVGEKIRDKCTGIEGQIVMLTAKIQVADLVQGFNAGANDFLTKPFVKNELLARIKLTSVWQKSMQLTVNLSPTTFCDFWDTKVLLMSD